MKPLTQAELSPGVIVSAFPGVTHRPNPEDEVPFIALEWEEEVDEEVGQKPREVWLPLSELRPFIQFLQDTEKAMEDLKTKGRDPR